MTTEEKAKAYDEALKRAKAAIDVAADKDLVRGVVRTVFPELRESEDERIINQLITLVNSTGEVLLIPTNKEELVAWLNKCKESLHISETCKENADSFTSEDERIRKWLIDYFGSIKKTVWIHRDITCEQILGWIEKQKENPKNAISIPSDCVSDAKCEDRWHKTANSLPDDGRDVLAKDAIGNYLLASFDGAQWFVSVYDGEDHPVLHTPPILEWCEILSEKQKGQEHICDSAQFEEGFKTGLEIGLRKQKEQKPTWSEEDEEMYSRIVRRYTDYEGVIMRTKEESVANKMLDAMAQEEIWLKERLKSLRPSWKPSEEQMEAVKCAALDVKRYSSKSVQLELENEPYYGALISLYNDLKKL